MTHPPDETPVLQPKSASAVWPSTTDRCTARQRRYLSEERQRTRKGTILAKKGRENTRKAACLSLPLQHRKQRRCPSEERQRKRKANAVSLALSRCSSPPAHLSAGPPSSQPDPLRKCTVTPAVEVRGQCTAGGQEKKAGSQGTVVGKQWKGGGKVKERSRNGIERTGKGSKRTPARPCSAAGAPRRPRHLRETAR